MKNQDDQADKVKDFVTVLKLFEEELFGDAYYDTNFRKNVKDRKPINLPNYNDVKILLDECNKIMNSPDIFNMCATSFVLIRAAAATCLIIFNARRGGEPVRLLISQWEEALKGEWVDENDLPDEVDSSVLVTYQTGKGSNHLVPVMFPPECHKALKYLTDKDIRSGAGVCPKNMYIFPSTKKSDSHPDGWHCINDILVKLDKKCALNATANRHRVATLLARLQLTEKEKEMIFKHFGHSKNMNENRYQAAPGSMQLRTTGSRLLEIQGSSSKSKQDVKIQCSKKTKKDDEIDMVIKTKVDAIPIRRSIPPTENDGNLEVKDSSEDEDDSIIDDEEDYSPPKKSKGRAYTVWKESSKRAFDNQFQKILKQDRGYPGRKEMEEFAEKHNMTYTQVRMRFVNVRRLREERAKNLRKKLNIE